MLMVSVSLLRRCECQIVRHLAATATYPSCNATNILEATQISTLKPLIFVKSELKWPIRKLIPVVIIANQSLVTVLGLCFCMV